MSTPEKALNSRAKAVFSGAFALSLAAHGVAYASLTNRAPTPRAAVKVSTVSFEVKAPPPPPEAPPTAPEPAPTQSPAPALEKVSSPKTPLPAPAQAAATPPSAATKGAAAPLDLSGVTLTNDNGGFAMPTGDGSALHGPIGLGAQRNALASPSAAATPVVTTGPRLVAARDLSEHPRPPSLEGLLRANYPDEARQRGLRGSARVRARIDADGVIRSATLVGESSAGFGSACRRTVVGSRWSPPRAQNGDAVATEIVYTCHFEVD